MDITLLSFIFKFTYAYFLAGIIVCTGIYIFAIVYPMYLKRTKYRTWLAVDSTVLTSEAHSKLNKRKVFKLIFVLAILFKMFWI